MTPLSFGSPLVALLAQLARSQADRMLDMGFEPQSLWWKEIQSEKGVDHGFTAGRNVCTMYIYIESINMYVSVVCMSICLHSWMVNT